VLNELDTLHCARFVSTETSLEQGRRGRVSKAHQRYSTRIIAGCLRLNLTAVDLQRNTTKRGTPISPVPGYGTVCIVSWSLYWFKQCTALIQGGLASGVRLCRRHHRPSGHPQGVGLELERRSQQHVAQDAIRRVPHVDFLYSTRSPFIVALSTVLNGARPHQYSRARLVGKLRQCSSISRNSLPS